MHHWGISKTSILFLLQSRIIHWLNVLCYFPPALAIKVQEFEGRQNTLPWCDQWQQQKINWKLDYGVCYLLFISINTVLNNRHICHLCKERKKTKIVPIGLLTGSQNCSVRQRKRQCTLIEQETPEQTALRWLQRSICRHYDTFSLDLTFVI